MSASPFIYHYIEGVERLECYQPGGYHPTRIGDCLHGRYRIVHKLGHGAYSTIWLARDDHLSTFFAIKIGMADSSRHEVDVLSRINATSPVPLLLKGSETRRKPLVPAVLDSFSIHGPNGTHFCSVTYPASRSLEGAKKTSTCALFQLHVARALVAQLAMAVAHVHAQSYVHGGQLVTGLSGQRGGCSLTVFVFQWHQSFHKRPV